MSKFFSITILGCLLSFVAYAQTNPSRANATSTRDLHGAIEPLSASQSWTTIYPENLRYWKKPSGPNTAISGYPQRMSSRQARRGATADFTFTFLSEGINVIEISEPGRHQNGGLVVDVSYTFPCILQVTDAGGNILKEFELSCEENVMTAMLHPGFLEETPPSRPGIIPTPVTGFPPDEIDTALENNMEQYLTRIELDAFRGFVNRAATIISYGYGNPRVLNTPIVLEVNRREKTQFVELNEKIDELKSTIAEYFSAPINDDVQNRLITLGKYFEANYNPKTASKDVLQLYAFNAAMAYLFGGATDDAYRQYRIVSPTFGSLSAAAAVFENLFPEIADINNLYATKNELQVVDVPALKVSELVAQERAAEQQAQQQERNEQIAARQQDLEARNVSDVQGYVMTKNGEKIEGSISLKFVETTTTYIRDLDLARLVWVRGARVQTFRPNVVSYIMAGDVRFEPVSRAIASNYFMEVVYKNEGSTAFIDRTATAAKTYYVKGTEGSRVEMYNTILRGTRPAERFFANVSCPGLLERVKAGEFSSSKESLIQFVDALAECAK
jgi:hypothetical protein